MTHQLGNLAVVGSGPTALYLLKHILDHADRLRVNLVSVTVLEQGNTAGFGMPYHPETTDRYNLANISSEEIPMLLEPLADWLKSRPDRELNEWGIERDNLSASEVYPRLALGAYLKDQFDDIEKLITASGIPVHVLTSHHVSDIRKTENGTLSLSILNGDVMAFDSVVIATGHTWPEDDDVEHGRYFSPWPIGKLLPAADTFLHTTVGILGASLSAFDVVTSLAHRHGCFVRTDMGLKYEAYPGTEAFGLILHSREGWLPHLQFDQEEPFREIYRHVDREELFALVDDRGCLRLETYFDKVCRPALQKAFEKDAIEELVTLLDDPKFGLEEFVEKMSGIHRHVNAFEGMGAEMVEARASVLHHKPIHWKEIIDDLMFTLNYHAELLPAEDHLLYHKVVNPFLMNVIAALPLPSGSILLALHEAGVLKLERGSVTVDEDQSVPGMTSVTIEDDEESRQVRYGMFVECGGQKTLGIDAYPFPSLVKDGVVCEATARFVEQNSVNDVPPDKVVMRNEEKVLLIRGVAIDAAYRVLRSDATPETRVFDLAFPHTSGIRPYSYGLQACSATSSITVKSWVEAIQKSAPVEGELEEVAEIYESV